MEGGEVNVYSYFALSPDNSFARRGLGAVGHSELVVLILEEAVITFIEHAYNISLLI
jgi:hypothetical protein